MTHEFPFTEEALMSILGSKLQGQRTCSQLPPICTCQLTRTVNLERIPLKIVPQYFVKVTFTLLIDSFTVKNQKDTITTFVKNPLLLLEPIEEFDCVGRRLCLDEDFCSVLVPKLMESMCRAGAFDGSSLEAILKFFSVVIKVSVECKKRMPGWLLQFIPNMIVEHRPALISALPTFLPSLEGVLEDALFKNFRDGRKDLAEASFTCLLRFKSAKMANFFNNDDEVKVEKLSLPALIEASRAFTHSSALKARIRELLTLELETGKLDLDAIASIEFTSTNATEAVDLLLLLIACSKSDSITVHRQFHRACLTTPDQTLHLLQQLPSSSDALFSSALLELFSAFLEVSGEPAADAEMSQNTSTPSTAIILFAFAKRFLNSSKEKAFLNVLACNILSGSEGSGMASLQLLQRVIQISPSSRWSCLGVIKTLLDGLESMPPAKLSLFYTVFAFLAQDSDTVSNELLLLLKKQLYSFDPVYKRIGARGVIIFCSVLGEVKSKLLPDPDEFGNESDDECIAGCSQMPATTGTRIPLPAYSTRLVIGLLEEAVKSLRQDPVAFALLLLGLSSLFSENQQIEAEIIEWIAEWITSFFKDEFIKEAESEDDPSLQFDCDDGENVLFLDLTGPWSSVAPLAFRLLAKSELMLSAGSLEAIDALHGCPFRIVSVEEQGLLSASLLLARRFACLSLMREMVRTFTADEEKNLKRLTGVAQLEASLTTIISAKVAYLDEFRLYQGCFLTTLESNIEQIEEEVEIITNTLILECLAEGNNKKLTPLRRKIEEGTQLTPKSAAEGFPLPVAVLKAALLSPVQEVFEFCLNQGRGQFDDEFLVELWTRKGPKAELLNQLADKESLSFDARRIAQEAWSNQEAFEVRIVAFKLLRKFDQQGFQESPIEIIKQQQSHDLIPLLTGEESFQLCQAIFPFEAERGKCSLPVFKALLQRISSLLGLADLSSIEKLLSALTHLLQFARVEGNNAWLLAVLKGVRPALQGLLKPTCPFFLQLEEEGVLVQAEQRNAALGLLRQLQQCTRSLQVICAHLKYSTLSKRSSSSNNSSIPVLRKALESLILRVGAAVARCGCSEAFWVGNLKHRDLEGEELSSQVALMDLTESDSDNVSGSESEGVFDESDDLQLSKEFISSTSASE